MQGKNTEGGCFRMGRRMCRHERKEVGGRFTKLYKEELHNSYSSTIIVRVMK
jgi:hypothetical protein